MNTYLFLIIFSFIFVNLYIILHDIRTQKIRNRYLGVLSGIFVLYMIYHLGSYQEYIGTFTLYAFGSLIVGFMLSFFRIWGAGDAKYYILLSLFVFPYGYFIYPANIVILTLIFLLVLFLKHIIGKNKNGVYLGTLIKNDIYFQLSRTKKKYLSSKVQGSMFIINTINILLLIFLLFRTIKLLLFEVILESHIASYISSENIAYALLIGMFLLLYVGRVLVQQQFEKIKAFLPLSEGETQSLSNILLAFVLTPLIYFDYTKNPTTFFDDMYKIITISFCIYLGVRGIIYIYKKCFIDMETSVIKIEDLKNGDIIYHKFMKDRIYPLLKRKPQSNENEDVVIPLIKKHYPEEPVISIMHAFPFSIVLFGACILSLILESSPLFIIIDIGKNLIFHL